MKWRLRSSFWLSSSVGIQQRNSKSENYSYYSNTIFRAAAFVCRGLIYFFGVTQTGRSWNRALISEYLTVCHLFSCSHMPANNYHTDSEWSGNLIIILLYLDLYFEISTCPLDMIVKHPRSTETLSRLSWQAWISQISRNRKLCHSELGPRRTRPGFLSARIPED